MEKERKGVLVLLFIFLAITVGVLLLSLPSNLFSPVKNSATEVSLLEYSEASETARAGSHIFIHSDEARTVELRGISQENILKTNPSAEFEGDPEGRLFWEGVFSKRSRTYYQNREYGSLFYEVKLSFKNSLAISIEAKEGERPVAVLMNNGSEPLEDIFVSYQYFDGQGMLWHSGRLSKLSPGREVSLELERDFADRNELIAAMEAEGISPHAAGFLFSENNWNPLQAIIYPGRVDSKTVSLRVMYRLPDAVYRTLFPLYINPEPSRFDRFAWVLVAEEDPVFSGPESGGSSV